MKMFVLPPRESLQRRLSVALACGVTALWLIATLGAGLILREEIDEVFDSALQEVVQRVLPLAYIEVLNLQADAQEGAPPERIAPVGPHKEFITYIVRDSKGSILLQSHDAEPAIFPVALKPGFADGQGSRFYTEAAVRDTIFVTAAERPGHRRSSVIEAVGMLALPLILLLPLSIVMIWKLVARTLLPVIAFQHQIEARGSSNLSPMDTKALPFEISPVAGSVNRLMARLRNTLEAERSFTANSAHELRTPVAAALAQTQRLIAELPEGPPRLRAREIETALRRLTRLGEKLLQLAKAEGGGLLAETPQDISQALSLVLADFRTNAVDARRITLALPVAEHLYSRIDVDAFAILARNLIENALKHGSPEQPVTVSLTDKAVFSVTNGGPAINPETLARFMRPFERGDTIADGSGLGLAIAQTIALGAGGQIDLFSPVPGRTDGFEARIHLSLYDATT